MIIGVVGYKGSGKNTVADMICELVEDVELVAFADPMKEFCQRVYDFSYESLWGPSELREIPDKRYPHPMLEGWEWKSTPPSDKSSVTNSYALHNEAGLPVVCISPKNQAALVTCYNDAIVLTEFVSFDGTRTFSVGETLELEHSGDIDIETGALQKEVQGIVFGCVTPREALEHLGTEWGRGRYEDTWRDLGMREAAAKLAGGASLVIITDCRFQNEAEAVSKSGGLVFRVSRPGLSAGEHRSEQEQETMRVDEDIQNIHGLDYLKAHVAAVLLSRGLIPPKVLMTMLLDGPNVKMSMGALVDDQECTLCDDDKGLGFSDDTLVVDLVGSGQGSMIAEAVLAAAHAAEDVQPVLDESLRDDDRRTAYLTVNKPAGTIRIDAKHVMQGFMQRMEGPAVWRAFISDLGWEDRTDTFFCEFTTDNELVFNIEAAKRVCSSYQIDLVIR